MRFKLLIHFLIGNACLALGQSEDNLIDTDLMKQSQTEEAVPNIKIDLNDLEAYTLLSPQLLSIEQINAIRLHCAEYGPLSLLQELQTIKVCQSIDLVLLNQYIQNTSLNKQMHQSNCISFCSSFPMPSQQGFNRTDSSRFLGKNIKQQLAIKWANQCWGIRLQAEKDAGEPWQYSSLFGSITYQHKKQVLVLGDQHLILGQGLLIGTKQSFYNSLNFQIVQQSDAIRPKTDYAENGSIRGIGYSHQINRYWSLHGLYGKCLLDLINKQQMISNGLYRNSKEYSEKFKGSFDVWAISSQLKLKRTTVALNVQKSFSVSFKLPLKNWYCFGEISTDRKGVNYLLGGMRPFGQALDLAITIKHTPQKSSSVLLQSVYAVFDHAISEYNLSCQIKPIKKLLLKSQCCIAESIPKNLIQQFDSYFQLSVSYKPNKQTEMSCLYSSKQNNVYVMASNASKNNLKFQLKHESINLKSLTQLQIKTITQSAYYGYCLSHSLSFKLSPLLKINLMAATFNTFENPDGIYLYENNIPGQQTLFSYYHKGFHWFVMLQTKCIKDLNFWIRFASTSYAQEQTFGHGIDQFTSSYKSNLNTGIKWTF